LSETTALDAITVNFERQPDGRIAIIVNLPGDEPFKRSVWIREKEECEKLVNELCAEHPGIGSEERIVIRGEIAKIKRATEIDLRFNTHGTVNGRAHASIDLRVGNRIKWSESGNLLDAGFRRRAIANFARAHAGRNASKKKLEAIERKIEGQFLKAIEEARAKPPDFSRPAFSRDTVPYSIDEHGINWLTKTREGQDVVKPLTNFTAKIVAEVTRDDGSGEPELEFELEVGGSCCPSDNVEEPPKPGHRFTVKASKFAEMNWPLEKLGTRGLVYAGQGSKDHARAAILWLSANPPRKHVHTHTGWIKSGDAWLFLHAAGGIGGDANVDVCLDGTLAGYEFPTPPSDSLGIRAAIRASLRILELGPAEIVYPAYCAIWRSILGRCNFAVHLVGRSGVCKSELAALVQQHFGRDMHALNLPAAWRSTDNALGELLFLAKDVLCTIDDFKPLGTQQDVQKWHAKADNIFRGQGNGAGKQRMRAEGGLRVTKPPRGMVLSTGEQIPRGESCRARMLIIQISPGDIRKGEWLGSYQKEAREGLYAAATSAFVQWLAKDSRIETIRQDLREAVVKLRDRAQSSELHARTPEIVANLYVGLLYWLEFATLKNAISASEAKTIQDAAWTALGKAAEAQVDHQVASEPATRYLELLMSAIASGKAHLAGLDGGCPGEDGAAACGWRKRYQQWEPQGTRIGWIQDAEIYLEPDAAYNVAQAAAGDTGSGLVDSEREIRKRLEERGLLRAGGGDSRFNRRAIRKQIEGAQRWVVFLAPGALPLCARAARASGDGSMQPASFFDQK